MAHSYLTEQIEQGTGKFDPKKQYAFTNWSEEPFSFKWSGEEYVIQPGEIAVYPQYLAYHACKHFVNDRMTKDGKDVQLMNKDVRKTYEEKTLREVAPGHEDPYTMSIREQERARLITEMGLAGSDMGVTSSETIREAIEQKNALIEKETAEEARKKDIADKRKESLAKAREAKKEYAKANTE